jgi:hypothetical protein
VSGVGQTPLGSVEGTWVVGFFQDGADAQQPIIIGTLPGVPSSLPDTGSNKGFQDHTNANYPKYKETDVNRLAVNEKSGLLELNPHSTLTLRRADRDIFVGQADWTQTELRINQGLTVTLPVDDGKSFSEPATPYGAVYPYNHVVETESGHIRELDDTPGAERIHERHASGSGYEIAADGTKVTRVKKDNYDLITSDHYAHIKGNHSTTVDGGVRVFVNANATADSNYTIEVGNNANVNIQVNKGNVNVVTTDGDINMKSGRNLNIEAAQGIRLQSQTVDISTAGQWTESTKNKTESTTNHVMNAAVQDINGTTQIDLN